MQGSSKEHEPSNCWQEQAMISTVNNMQPKNDDIMLHVHHHLISSFSWTSMLSICHAASPAVNHIAASTPALPAAHLTRGAEETCQIHREVTLADFSVMKLGSTTFEWGSAWDLHGSSCAGQRSKKRPRMSHTRSAQTNIWCCMNCARFICGNRVSWYSVRCSPSKEEREPTCCYL